MSFAMETDQFVRPVSPYGALHHFFAASSGLSEHLGQSFFFCSPVSPSGSTQLTGLLNAYS